MMKVIVPIDDQPSSQSVIDTLMGMRWVAGTEIKLLTVLHGGGGQSVDSSVVEHIEKLAIDLQTALPYYEIALFVRKGDPKKEILDLAEEVKADLILMGSNRKTGIERFILGSVSQGVLSEADCPVIISKVGDHAVRDPQSGFKCVLLPMDDSPYSDVALQWLAKFNWQPETKFILITIADSVPSHFATAAPAEAAKIVDEHRELLQMAQKNLQLRAQQLTQLLRTTNVVIEIGTGDASASIIDLAQVFKADLVVMGSHGRTGIKKLILGSVSQAVSQSAPCSVAVVRGILAKDESWQKTGVFNKAKLAPPPEKTDNSNRPRRDDDHTPHVLPGGIG